MNHLIQKTLQQGYYLAIDGCILFALMLASFQLHDLFF